MQVSSDYAVQMHGITKMFGTFCALENVNLDVEKGTIHAILGENGAGKSTLMNVLYGLYQGDSGETFINGKKVSINNPNDAIAYGIGMVHQHFMLVDNFTVAQNIILGNEVTNGFGFLNMKKARRQVEEIVQKYGLFVEPDARIEDISVGMQQRVEILKALYRGAELLILDEPTAVLTPQEIDDLIHIMHSLIEDGKTIIIITHKLKEIKASAKDCTIIRRGKFIDRVKVDDCTTQELAEKMVGRQVRFKAEKEPAKPGDVVLEINNITVKDDRKLDAVKNLSLKVRKGEIVGIAGIDGNGQKELLEAITNLSKTESGTIKINGKEIQNTSIRNVIDSKVATVHSDRHRRSIILDYSVAYNCVVERFGKKPFSNHGVLNDKEIHNYTSKLLKGYDVRPNDCEQMPIRGLSGGNQQKVVIAREVTNNPDLLIMDQPTRGLDVGAIEYVYQTMIEERDKGKAILLISLQLDEVLNVADSIAVIYDGQIVDIFSQDEADENTIGLLMAGGQKNANNS